MDEEWSRTVASRAVALYLCSGFLESFELGYSFCRIGGDACTESGQPRFASLLSPGGGSVGGEEGGIQEANIGMGCCTVTDGKYVWPEGFAHYVECHAVRPPSQFVTRVMENLRALRKAQASGRLRWTLDDDGRGGTTIPLAPATAVFLRDRTTLGMALPPEKEAEFRNKERVVRDHAASTCIAS